MKNELIAHVVPDKAAAETVQLKYKEVAEYKEEVSIWKMTLAVGPVPEYAADTFEKIVPYTVLDPFALTNWQLEKEHEVSGILKY
jgi:hypothetical protein